MELIVVLFVPPILQIIFSILHITNRIKTPLGVIAALTLFLGIIFSVLVSNFEEQQVVSSRKDGHCLDCGLVGVVFLFFGVFLTIIITPVFLALFILIKRYKIKIDTKGNNLS